MAKTKQTTDEVKQEDNFLFAIGTPEGEHVVRIALDGSIDYIKAGLTMNEASQAFWNSFEAVLPITAEVVMSFPNDAELGEYIRAKMTDKLQNK